jgi:hypothetical protein
VPATPVTPVTAADGTNSMSVAEAVVTATFAL